MPTMQGSVLVAANAVSANQLAGLLYEFLDAPARITLSCTGSVTGENVTFLIAGVALINDSAIGLQNRFPVIPDDIMTQEDVPGGRMILTFRNTTAGGITAFWRVDIDFF